MKIGIIIKEIRLKKNISAVKLYKSILSKPAAIKFESGDSDTTVSKFFLILERLNITLEEFGTYHKIKNLDFYYVNNYINHFYKKDITSLKKLASEAQKEHSLKSVEKYRHYQAIILLLIDYLSESTEHLSHLEVIKGYLSTCEEWGYYEITLFANSLIFLPSDYIDIVYKQVKTKILAQNQLIRYRNEFALILFNIIEKKILEKDLVKLNFYISELNLSKKNTVDNMYIQTMIKYFNAIAEVISQDKYDEDIEQTVGKIIGFFDFLGLHTKSIQCQDLFQRTLSIYKHTQSET